MIGLSGATRPELLRAKRMFEERSSLESMWETAYQYILPERAPAFSNKPTQESDQRKVGAEVFDSEAIDSAERLVELLLNGLIPQGMRWFRIVPGPYLTDPDLRQRLAPLLELATQVVQTYFEQSNFFLEMQPMMLDRVVGGTGIIQWRPTGRGGNFRALPLSEVAIQEDYLGRIVATARQYYMTARDLRLAYGPRLPETWHQTYREGEANLDARTHLVVELEAETAARDWERKTFLVEGEVQLSEGVYTHRRTFPSRWAGMPGSVYGRGPGLRAIADVRAINKLKELSLKNAALAVGGVFTVVDDGVLNPYTISLQPGSLIPVVTNNPNDPPLLPVSTGADFNVAMFSMDDLRNSIKRVFLNDRFQPLGRTPLSALEVSERTRTLAESAGLATARLQQEVITPLLQAVFVYLGELGELPTELDLEGDDLRIEYIGPLARAQWAEDEQNILSMASYGAEFGQIDPKAGLAVNAHAAIRKLAEVKGVPPEIMRTEAEIEELIQQSADVDQELEEQDELG